MGGESVFGGQFDDENLTGTHESAGVVSMANAGKNMNGSQFFITTAAATHLDKSYVVVGRVVTGMDVLRQVDRTPVDSADAPLSPVVVDDCGCDSKPIPHVAVPLSQHPPVHEEPISREEKQRRFRQELAPGD